MANIILFTDRSPLTHSIDENFYLFERYSRPAGAYKIASTLRKHGYSVIVVPNCLRLSLTSIKEFIRQNSKDLIWVGLSTTFLTVKSPFVNDYREIWKSTNDRYVDLSILKNEYYVQMSVPTLLAWGTDELKLISKFISLNYNAKLCLGGTWVSHVKNGSIDVDSAEVHIITGMSEDYTVEMTHALSKNQDIPYQLSSINGEVDFKRSVIDYTANDIINSDEWLTLEVSRGCAFKCAYCTYDHKGKADTTKYTQTLKDEILKNYEYWGVTKYHLLDDLYNDSDYKIKLLYDEVWSALPFQPEWISYLRLDLLWSNPESAEWIKASGCKLGSFGIETLHDQAGKKVGKGLGKTRILETLENLKNVWGNDVLVTALMIAGLPGEPYEHIVETMHWLKRTDLIHSYKYAPLWVTPPEHKPFALKQNSMSDDYEKYQLSWGPDGWVNNVGVNFKMVSDLVSTDDKNYVSKFFPVDLIEYPELRFLGHKHKDLVNRNLNTNILIDIKNQNYKINNLVEERLEKILKITD
jgi:hypothetical protein